MSKGKNARVDPAFEKRARELMQMRLDSKLAKFNVRELGLPEFTRLCMRTQSWKGLEEELKTKPKKE